MFFFFWKLFFWLFVDPKLSGFIEIMFVGWKIFLELNSFIWLSLRNLSLLFFYKIIRFDSKSRNFKIRKKFIPPKTSFYQLLYWPNSIFNKCVTLINSEKKIQFLNPTHIKLQQHKFTLSLGFSFKSFIYEGWFVMIISFSIFAVLAMYYFPPFIKIRVASFSHPCVDQISNCQWWTGFYFPVAVQIIRSW